MPTENFRAILIDPVRRVIEETTMVVTDGDTLHALYAMIGCTDVNAVNVGGGHCMWVDGEALLRPWKDQAFFRILGNDPIAGRGVILAQKGPETVACTAPVGPVQRAITWVEPKDVVVPAPAFVSLDDKMQPDGEPIVIDGGPKQWTFKTHGGEGKS